LPSGAAESTAHQSLGSGSLSHALARASQASSTATVDLKNASQLPPTHHPKPTWPQIGSSPHPSQPHYHRARPLPFPRHCPPFLLGPRGPIAVLVASAPSLHRHVDVVCMAYKLRLSATIICDTLLAVKWATTYGWHQASATPILTIVAAPGVARSSLSNLSSPASTAPCADVPSGPGAPVRGWLMIGAPSCPPRPNVPCTPAA